MSDTLLQGLLTSTEAKELRVYAFGFIERAIRAQAERYNQEAEGNPSLVAYIGIIMMPISGTSFHHSLLCF